MAWFVKALNKDEKGFTLIELIVVIAILGILAAIAVPRVTGSLNTAKTNADKANAQIIGQAAERYFLEQGSAPTSINDLVTKGYLNKVPTPSSGGSFNLSVDSSGNATVSVGTQQLYP